MRLTYFGTTWRTPPAGEKPEVGQDGAHSYNALGREFCAALRDLGVEASQTNFWHTNEAAVPNSDAFDAVFIADHGMFDLWTQVSHDWDWDKKIGIFNIHIVDLSPTTASGRYCQFALKHAKLITFIHERVREQFLYEFGYEHAQRCHVMEWGVCGNWQWPPAEPSPYDPAKKIVLWAGRTYYRAIPLFAYLADWLPTIGAELHVLRAPDPAITLPDSHIPGIMHGTMKHGTFNHYLYYADVGLDVGTCLVEAPVVHCKIFDYLYAGLPVVHERVLGSEYARRLKMSCVIDGPRDGGHVDCEAYLQAIKVAVGQLWPRQAARDYMRQNHTWTKRAWGVRNALEGLGLLKT